MSETTDGLVTAMTRGYYAHHAYHEHKDGPSAVYADCYQSHREEFQAAAVRAYLKDVLCDACKKKLGDV